MNNEIIKKVYILLPKDFFDFDLKWPLITSDDNCI